MAVIRKKSLRYTIVPNDLLEDESIDLKAKGLIVYLLSKPDTWQVSPSHLCKHCRVSRNTIYKLLNQLKAKGYAHFRKLASGDSEWIITNYPDTNFWDEGSTTPDTKKEDKALEHLIPKKPDSKNCTLVSTDKTLVSTERDYPPELNVIAWDEFLDYRAKSKFKKLLPQSEDKLIAKLIRFGGHEIQQQCIDESISNGWQGVFPPKGGKDGKRNQSNADRQFEAISKL